MNHQKLICYGRLLEVAKRMPTLESRIPRGNTYIVDQIKRALSSAILNLAEGNSRFSNRERNRFFDISIASIAEVSAAIDIVFAYGYIPACINREYKEELTIAYSMIMKLKK